MDPASLDWWRALYHALGGDLVRNCVVIPLIIAVAAGLRRTYLCDRGRERRLPNVTVTDDTDDRQELVDAAWMRVSS